MEKPPYRLDDFVCGHQPGLYMLPEHPTGGDFAYSDGDEAEEYVLRCIQQAGDVSDNSPELARRARDWASYYHLAAGRANHLRALGLPKDIAILELGAGCGALSRYLGEHHRQVHAVEGSLRRARIARERCRGLDNVGVYCADFGTLALSPDYDLVLLNGVLEYAPIFLKSHGVPPDQAARTLLQLARSGLKPGGVVVIAIENKIGLKYWCGAQEDHTGRLYDGIHGYPTPGTAVTYSKMELTALLAAAGLPHSRFYGCFPDYKFATSLLTEGHAAQGEAFLHNWIPYPAENPGLSRAYLIHEGLAAKTLNGAGLLHEFANSFLIVASDRSSALFDSSLNPKWLAAKVSVANRARALHCITRLYPERAEVEKARIEYPGLGDARPSLGHLAHSAPWVPGNSLSWEAASASISRRFADQIPLLLEEYHGELLRRFATGDTDGEGFPQLRGAAFDFIMTNIIRTPEGSLEGIDDEWQLDRTLAVDYVLYRSLCHDVIGPNQRWMGMTLGDTDSFAIGMIRRLYPEYDEKRHQMNRALEAEILLSIRGNQEGAAWNPAPDGPAWKRLVKSIARRVPANVRRKVLRLSESLHEKTLAVFYTGES